MPKKDSNGNPLGQGRRLQRRSEGVADWETVDGQILVRAIAAAASVGGAIRCGYSRDGGAYAIGIYGDGEPYTEFLRPSEDINAFLGELLELFESLLDERATAREAKKNGK